MGRPCTDVLKCQSPSGHHTSPPIQLMGAAQCRDGLVDKPIAWVVQSVTTLSDREGVRVSPGTAPNKSSAEFSAQVPLRLRSMILPAFSRMSAASSTSAPASDGP